MRGGDNLSLFFMNNLVEMVKVYTDRKISLTESMIIILSSSAVLVPGLTILTISDFFLKIKLGY